MNTQQTVTLTHIELTFEDLNNIDAILGNLPYKAVKPVYDLINSKIQEQTQALLKKQQEIKG